MVAERCLSFQDSQKSALHLLCENEAVSDEALRTLLKSKPEVNSVDEVHKAQKNVVDVGCCVTEPDG